MTIASPPPAPRDLDPFKPAAARPRLIICDDHRMLVDALCEALARDHEIVGVAFDGDALLDVVRRTRADCLLLDLLLPKRDGLELIPPVRALQPPMRILAVTMVLDRRTAAAAFRAGAHGYVPKDAPLDELKSAIREVLAGHRYLSPAVPKNTRRVGVRALHPALCNLTPRQERVLVMMGEGKLESEIAQALGLSPAAITVHIQRLMRVFGLDSKASLKKLGFLVGGALDGKPTRHGHWGATAPRAPPRYEPQGPSSDSEPPDP